MRRSGFREEEDAKIFCVEDHRRALNFSSENIKICCEDKLEYLKRHSSSISPHRSPRKHECRIQRQDGIECLVHRAKDIRKNCPLIRSNARRRKCSQKIEGSLSAEEQNLSRGILKDRTVDSATTRSASFSPTANLFKSSFSFQHDSSIIHTSLAGRSTPSINDNGAQKVSNLELIGDVAEAQASTNKEKEEKIELEEPS